MNLHRITHSPDTCAGFAQNKGCVFEYDLDADDPVAVPILRLVQRKCSRHGMLTDTVAFQRAYFEEMQVKNQAEAQLFTTVAELSEPCWRLELMDGTTAHLPLAKMPPAMAALVRLQDQDQVPDAGRWTWTIDAQSVLHVQLPTLPVNRRAPVQTALDAKFGPGKVVLG